MASEDGIFHIDVRFENLMYPMKNDDSKFTNLLIKHKLIGLVLVYKFTRTSCEFIIINGIHVPLSMNFENKGKAQD